MNIAVLTLHLHLPMCQSLKEKRSRIKPLLYRIHKEFNLSTAEIGLNDHWQEGMVACALVSNDANHAHRVLQQVVEFIPTCFPDLEIIDCHIENI